MKFIALSKENINLITNKNLMLCLFSEMGAEGNPGMISFFVNHSDEAICYQANYTLGEVKLDVLRRKFPAINSFFKSESIKGYQYEDLGSGNHLLINNNNYFDFTEIIENLSDSDVYNTITDIVEDIFKKHCENSYKNYNLVWSRDGLNKQKLGTFCEYYAKMALTSYGMNIYSSEVDDHGIDFVVESKKGFLKFQVKSIRLESTRYAFVHEKDFDITDSNMYLFLILLVDGEHPDCYIIPATAWNKIGKTNLFVHHANYKKPEYGVNVSDKNMIELQNYNMRSIVNGLI